MAVAQSNKNNSSLQINWIENTSLCNCHSVPPAPRPPSRTPPSTQFGLIKATCTAALKGLFKKWQNYSRFKSGEGKELKTFCCSDTVVDLKHCFPFDIMNWRNQNHFFLMKEKTEKKLYIFTSFFIFCVFTFVFFFLFIYLFFYMFSSGWSPCIYTPVRVGVEMEQFWPKHI